MNQLREKKNTSFKELFSRTISYSYMLLLILLCFNTLRPDCLLPGGKILMYTPALLTCLLLLQLLRAKRKVLENSQTKYFILIMVLMLFQLPFARNTGFSTMAVKSMFTYGITSYLFIVQFVDNYVKLDRYIRLFVILSLVVALLGIIGAGKVDVSVLHDENDFCLLMNILIPFTFFLAQDAKDSKKRFFYFALLIIYLCGNISTFSRGGFIGLVALSLYVFFIMRHKMLFMIIAGILTFAVVLWAPPRYLAEIRSIDTNSYQRDTGATRIDSWKAGWKMFKDHPLIGVGAYNFGVCLPDYWDQNDNPDKMWGRVAHSLYFTLIPEMGIIGTFCFLGMLWGNYNDHSYICGLEQRKTDCLISSGFTQEEKEELSSSIRTLHFFSKSCVAAMIAYLVTGAFLSVLWYDYFWKLTALWVVNGNIARNIENMMIASNMQSVG